MQLKATVIEVAPADSYAVVRFQFTSGSSDCGAISVAVELADAENYSVGLEVEVTL